MTTLVVLGDSLLDRDVDGTVERVCPDAPVPVVDAGTERARPGGAALAAALLAGSTDDVVLVTAIGSDGPGRELLAMLDAAGVDVVDLGLRGPTPEKVRVRADAQSLLRLDRGGPPAPISPLTPRARAAISTADAVLVADYGRGLAARADVRERLLQLGRTQLVWDPHRLGPPAVPGVSLVTPNLAEASAACPGIDAQSLAGHVALAHALAARWRAGAVALTMGRRGALLVGATGAPLVVPPPAEVDGDSCGAGDAFAGAATRALAHGAVLSEAVEAAVARASTFVAAGAAAAFGSDPEPRRDPTGGTRPAAEVIAEVRRRNGIVVATGGCFDLLHAGHAAMLRAARRLGDCLIVCLNGDESVRRLKGPDRPLQGETDRAVLLAALDCVDAVEVFDEPTPMALLERLRPDVFVKGGDYAAVELPEAATLARWGGQVVVVPYLAGRSSSRLIEEVRRVPS
jgi:rfaE bifunctional protein nucleotidyltransferase chain/domain/rfaE bifunctional protein kinase chain/domain